MIPCCSCIDLIFRRRSENSPNNYSSFAEPSDSIDSIEYKQIIMERYLENQNKLKKEKLKSVLQYVTEKKVCKSQLILNYGGETTTKKCGICSFCIQQNKSEANPIPLTEQIIALLKEKPMSSREMQLLTTNSTDAIIFALQQLLEQEHIIIKPNNQYTLRS